MSKELCIHYKDSLIKIVVYGSYARNKQTKDSDVDIAMFVKNKIANMYIYGVLNRNREIKAAQADQHIDEYYYDVNGTGAALLSSTKTAVTSPYSSQGYDGLYSLYTHADVLDTGYYYDLYSDHRL